MHHSSGMDYSRKAGSILIPTRFVWPYGGRNVSICGSFTGWNTRPMTPVEGCPTAFQTICSVPPGYHPVLLIAFLYKFCIDGEWRHDQHQPYITSNYGNVNTVLLARESDYQPMLTPQTPHDSNMDVDNEAFQRLQVAVSDGRISDADIELTRHRISEFLSTHTAYELLPRSGKVIALDVDLPLKQAFPILHEQGIPMAPLWDFCKGQFFVILSALDFS